MLDTLISGLIVGIGLVLFFGYLYVVFASLLSFLCSVGRFINDLAKIDSDKSNFEQIPEVAEVRGYPISKRDFYPY